MRYLSVCSGIEAASVAWHSIGWQPVAFAEIDKFPSAVLEARWPGVPNLGDMTSIEGEKYHGAVDVLIGGTPCQDFSIAGKRAGLSGERSGLAMHFARLVRDIQPRWIIWENVPGAFSTNRGRDFSAFVGTLADFGYGLAWRVLDAQYWGVPQRRKRIFLVGYFGDVRPAGAVLFERESLRRDTAARRKARQTSARESEIGPAKCLLSRRRSDFETENLIAGTLCASGAGLSRPAGQGNELDFLVPAVPPVVMRMREGAPGEGKGPLLSEDRSLTLATGNDQVVFLPRLAVRRFTPRECERLQGFPDDYTLISEASDTARYKALGNSMAVPVVRWLGERIAKVEHQLQGAHHAHP